MVKTLDARRLAVDTDNSWPDRSYCSGVLSVRKSDGIRSYLKCEINALFMSYMFATNYILSAISYHLSKSYIG